MKENSEDSGNLEVALCMHDLSQILFSANDYLYHPPETACSLLLSMKNGTDEFILYETTCPL